MYRKIGKPAIIGAALFLNICFFISGISFAQEAETISDKEEKFDPITQFTMPVKHKLREMNIDLDFFVGELLGYDNNVNLDPNRDKAAFLQSTFDLDAVYNFTDDIRLETIFDVTDIKYFDYTDADLFDGTAAVNFETDFFDDVFTVTSGYMFDFSWYPFEETSTHYNNEASVSLKHRITESLYHKFRYKYVDKRYTKRKVYSTQNIQISDLRHDARNTFEYEIGFFLMQSLIKLKGHYYINDSNDRYQDYYDYVSYKIKPSIIHGFTKKLYTITSFAYEQRQYDSRVSSEKSVKVWDDTYTANVSFFYEITPSFTIAVNYSYRENVSNEPSQRYSGSLFMGGAYYTF